MKADFFGHYFKNFTNNNIILNMVFKMIKRSANKIRDT